MYREQIKKIYAEGQKKVEKEFRMGDEDREKIFQMKDIIKSPINKDK